MPSRATQTFWHMVVHGNLANTILWCITCIIELTRQRNGFFFEFHHWVCAKGAFSFPISSQHNVENCFLHWTADKIELTHGGTEIRGKAKCRKKFTSFLSFFPENRMVPQWKRRQVVHLEGQITGKYMWSHINFERVGSRIETGSFGQCAVTFVIWYIHLKIMKKHRSLKKIPGGIKTLWTTRDWCSMNPVEISSLHRFALFTVRAHFTLGATRSSFISHCWNATAALSPSHFARPALLIFKFDTEIKEAFFIMESISRATPLASNGTLSDLVFHANAQWVIEALMELVRFALCYAPSCLWNYRFCGCLTVPIFSIHGETEVCNSITVKRPKSIWFYRCSQMNDRRDRKSELMQKPDQSIRRKKRKKKRTENRVFIPGRNVLFMRKTKSKTTLTFQGHVKFLFSFPVGSGQEVNSQKIQRKKRKKNCWTRN